MTNEFLLPFILPPCECGAEDWIAGLFLAHGMRYRCEACKQVYKAEVLSVRLEKANEPVAATP